MPRHLWTHIRNFAALRRLIRTIPRLVRCSLTLVLLSLVTACQITTDGSAWTQFHGGSSNRGYQPARSNLLSVPRWTVEVGPVGFGSPVLATDGSIYLAAIDSLVAVNPAGTIRWKRSVGADKFLSSAAVGSSGRIYVVSTRQDDSKLFKVGSTLHAFTPSGTRLWSFDLPDDGFT